MNRCRRSGEALLGVAILVLTMGVIAACGTPDATFELDLPASVASRAAWYEIGVFDGGCPAPALLLGGVPAQGVVARLAFAADAATPPALGVLPEGTFGVAAVARAADCSVIATGCATESVSSGTIAVALTAITGAAAGKCEAGSACRYAACVPVADAGVNAATACSLDLVGAGPLADPLNPETTLLGAPAIAATPAGFVIAYRELDPVAGQARLTTIAVDPTGAAAAPVQKSLPGACASSVEIDGTGLAFSGDAGTIAVSRPPCNDGGAGGVELLSIDPEGAVRGSSFSGQSGLSLTLGQGHALAITPTGLVLAYTNQDSQAYGAPVVGTTLEASQAFSYEALTGLASARAAYVIGTDYGTAFLAVGMTPDAGADAATTANLATLAADAGDASATASPGLPASWASANGVGDRILVASNGAAPDASIAWSAFDIGTAGALSGTFAPSSAGDVSFVDVAMHQDHAFFAAEVGQDISLFAFDKAAEVPVPLLEVDFATLPTVPLGLLRDGLVAVAASDTRVAVVWGTGKMLGSDDGVGGYAVFACATAGAPDASLSP